MALTVSGSGFPQPGRIAGRVPEIRQLRTRVSRPGEPSFDANDGASATPTAPIRAGVSLMSLFALRAVVDTRAGHAHMQIARNRPGHRRPRRGFGASSCPPHAGRTSAFTVSSGRRLTDGTVRHSPSPTTDCPVLSMIRSIGPLALFRVSHRSTLALRRERVVWSGTSRPTPSSLKRDPRNPSAWRSGK